MRTATYGAGGRVRDSSPRDSPPHSERIVPGRSSEVMKLTPSRRSRPESGLESSRRARRPWARIPNAQQRPSQLHKILSLTVSLDDSRTRAEAATFFLRESVWDFVFSPSSSYGCGMRAAEIAGTSSGTSLYGNSGTSSGTSLYGNSGTSLRRNTGTSRYANTRCARTPAPGRRSVQQFRRLCRRRHTTPEITAC